MGSCVGIRVVRARKTHRCYLCPLPIEAGTTYRTWAWISDGIWTVRVHPACEAYAETRIGAWADGGVEENAVAAYPDLARLVARVRASVEADVRPSA